MHFWDAFLCNTVVKSGYLSYCSLPVSLIQCDHSDVFMQTEVCIYMILCGYMLCCYMTWPIGQLFERAGVQLFLMKWRTFLSPSQIKSCFQAFFFFFLWQVLSCQVLEFMSYVRSWFNNKQDSQEFISVEEQLSAVSLWIYLSVEHLMHGLEHCVYLRSPFKYKIFVPCSSSVQISLINIFPECTIIFCLLNRATEVSVSSTNRRR